MNFVNTKTVTASKPLKAAHYPFNRGKNLFDAMSWCVTDYYTKASSDHPFEARGLLVIGESRQGKSCEIKRLLRKFNDGSVLMPDGRPATIIHCLLSGKLTWKDLGVKVLDKLGYALKGRRTQTNIWDMVIKYAKLQGVVGIYFDECQHVFSDRGEIINQQLLDCFKTLLKDTSWPLMLILSGIPTLAAHIAKEEQLARLLRIVRFEDIDLSRQSDKDEMLQLTYSYAERAALDFTSLATEDFLERLAFACCNRWGLVIEMLIEAFTRARYLEETICTIDHFSHVYAETHSTPVGYSPFTMPNYRDKFDQTQLLKFLKRTK
jgi:hypothetical protein